MKKVKLIIAVFVVISIVGNALAFRHPGLHLYSCDMSSETCFLADSRNFAIDIQHGTSFSQSALSIFDLTGETCSSACGSTIKAKLE